MAGVAPEHLDTRYTLGRENSSFYPDYSTGTSRSPYAATSRSPVAVGGGHVVEARRSPMYREAVAVGELREVDTGEEAEPPQTITKKFIRQIEVPFTREVKVPVKKKEIVPGVTRKTVPVRRLREVPVEKEVDEDYTEIQSVKKVRDKEVWVKQIVPEEYYEEVEIVKTRRVRVPATEIKEVEEMQEVEVHEDVVREVDGFRVDQVEDTKLVEVEEYQTYELHPQPTGEVQIGAQRDVGVARHPSHRSRVLGPVFPHHDTRIADVPVDEKPDHKQRVAYHTPSPNRRLLGLNNRSAGTNYGGSPARGGDYQRSPPPPSRLTPSSLARHDGGYGGSPGRTGSEVSRQDAVDIAGGMDQLSMGGYRGRGTLGGPRGSPY